jgi:hypothetical protein
MSDLPHIVYLLEHVYLWPWGEPERKIIGVYSSRERAQQTIEVLLPKPGFIDHPDDFRIIEWALNQEQPSNPLGTGKAGDRSLSRRQVALEQSGDIYELWYFTPKVSEHEDDEEEELVGLYSSHENAEAAIARLDNRRGFTAPRHRFEIFERRLDRGGWTGGFITV